MIEKIINVTVSVTMAIALVAIGLWIVIPQLFIFNSDAATKVMGLMIAGAFIAPAIILGSIAKDELRG